MADKTNSNIVGINSQEANAIEYYSENSNTFLNKIYKTEEKETNQTSENKNEKDTLLKTYHIAPSIFYLQNAKNSSTKDIENENRNKQHIWNNNKLNADGGPTSATDFTTETKKLKENEVKTTNKLLQGNNYYSVNSTTSKKQKTKNNNACRTVLKKLANGNNSIEFNKNVTTSCDSQKKFENKKMMTNVEPTNLFDAGMLHLEKNAVSDRCYESPLKLTYEKKPSVIELGYINKNSEEMNFYEGQSRECVPFNEISEDKYEFQEIKKQREKEKENANEKGSKKGEENVTEKREVVEEHIKNVSDEKLMHGKENHITSCKGHLKNVLKKMKRNNLGETKKYAIPEYVKLMSDMKHIKDTISLQYEKYKRNRKRRRKLARLHPIYYKEHKSLEFFNSYHRKKLNLTFYESEVNDYLSVIANLHNMLFKERENYKELKDMLNYTTAELENEKNRLYEELNIYKTKYNRLKKGISNIGYGSILNVSKKRSNPTNDYKDDSKSSRRDSLRSTQDIYTNGNIYEDNYVVVNSLQSTYEKKDNDNKIKRNNLSSNALLKFIDF